MLLVTIQVFIDFLPDFGIHRRLKTFLSWDVEIFGENWGTEVFSEDTKVCRARRRYYKWRYPGWLTAQSGVTAWWVRSVGDTSSLTDGHFLSSHMVCRPGGFWPPTVASKFVSFINRSIFPKIVAFQTIVVWGVDSRNCLHCALLAFLALCLTKFLYLITDERQLTTSLFWLLVLLFKTLEC